MLGSILLDGGAINKVLDLFSNDGSDFYHPGHAGIFKSMVDLFDSSSPIDTVTIIDHFKDSHLLDSLGGLSYIGQIAESTPTAANVVYYARIVKEKSILRQLIAAATEIVQNGFAERESVGEILDEAESVIFRIAKSMSIKNYYPVKELVGHAFETIEELYEKKSHITGVPTGYKDLDTLTAGMQSSDLIVVAGRPGMGKTAFALNVAENCAINDGNPVAVFSMEMSKEQLTQRMLSSRAKVNLQKIRSGQLREEDWTSLTTAVGTLYEAPIYIDDTPAQTVLEVRAKARRMRDEFGVKLFIVDYLQLMRGLASNDSREQEISYISRGLKALAKELNVPVMALSQLSRKTEERGRESSRPRLSDIRESGAIEQDADVVMFVYREGVYKKCECPRDDVCTCGLRKGAEVIVEKQRNGPTGTVKLTFFGEFARFEDQVQYDATGLYDPGMEE